MLTTKLQVFFSMSTRRRNKTLSPIMTWSAYSPKRLPCTDYTMGLSLAFDICCNFLSLFVILLFFLTFFQLKQT